MPSPSLLSSLLLCISLLLLPIVTSHKQSPSDATATVPVPKRRRATPYFAREFLVAHNKARINVTHPLLTWDKKLARYARRWGMKRVVDCRMVHSYGPYGENLFWGAQDHWTPTEAVESWTKERLFYNAQNNACSDGQMCGHYTQIIWRDSLRIGCTRVKCHTGGVLMICEYDPPGNYVNESPFDTVNNSGTRTGVGATATTTPTADPNSTKTVPSSPSNESAGSRNRKTAG